MDDAPVWPWIEEAVAELLHVAAQHVDAVALYAAQVGGNEYLGGISGVVIGKAKRSRSMAAAVALRGPGVTRIWSVVNYSPSKKRLTLSRFRALTVSSGTPNSMRRGSTRRITKR